MTFTLTSIRESVRVNLGDDSDAVWSDAQLERAIGAALGRYQRVIPHPKTATLTGLSGRSIDLSASAPSGLGTTDYAALISVDAIEYPVDEYPPDYVRFDWSGTTARLHLDTELASESVKVWYSITHTLDASSGTIVDGDRELLALGAAAEALAQLGARGIDQLTTGRDVAVRAAARADDLRAEFERLLQRRRPIRQNDLYRPVDPYKSSDTVAWPEA